MNDDYTVLLSLIPVNLAFHAVRPARPQVVTLKAGAEKKKGRRIEKDSEDEEVEEEGEKKRGRRKKAKSADQEGEENAVRFA